MNFFNIGWEELLVIMVIAVIFLGPDRLPVAMRAIARGIRNLRRWTADLQAEFNMITQELTSELDELRQVTRELQDELRGVQAELASEVQGVTDSLRQETEAAVAAVSGQALTSTGWSSSSPTGSGLSASATETASNGSGSTMASKGDPTVDVALFDSEETVVMPRSERPSWSSPSTNGHAASEAVVETVAVAEGAPRLPRRGRAASVAYLRPRRRSASSDVD